MANIELKIVALGDFSSVNTQIKALQAQVELLQKSVAGVGLKPEMANQLKNIQNEFSNALVSSGNFTKQTVQLTSETQKFGQALQSGKLSLGQYFGIITGRSASAQKSVQALAVEQVKLNNSIIQTDITKQGVYSVYTPTKIDELSKSTEIAAAKQNIYNLAVKEGSTQLINFGKNTQWAGRQLTVGLAMPAILFGSQAVTAFKAVNTELTRLQRLYGEGLTPPSQAQLNQISGQVLNLGKNIAQQMGIAQSETVKVAANFAAMGIQGQNLLNITTQTQRLSKLGAIDATQATAAIVSLQNVYKVSTQDLGNAVNFLSSMQKQTTMSLSDMTDAIPRVGPIMAQLGGTYKDTAVMLLAMKEAGVPAAQAANALKSAMASIIAPTSAATKEFASFGINLATIKNAGTPVQMIEALQSSLVRLAPLAREQLIEKLFGKFQFARVSALLDNFGKVGSQTQNALKVAGATNAQLATLAGQEMAQATQSTTAKWQRAIETLKADLYPIGQKILEVGTKIIDFGQKIADFFNKLPGPIKSGLGILLTLGVLAGPIIMITGLLANLMGQGMKVGYSLLGIIDGTKKWKDLLTPTSIAAKTATDAFNEGIMTNVASIDQLNAALVIMIDNLAKINMGQMTSAGGVLGSVEKAAAAELASGQLLLPGMATGGFVPGNPSDGDAYPAMLMGGEAVIPTKQAQAHAPLISALISGKLPHLESGTVRFEGLSPADMARKAEVTSFPGTIRKKIKSMYWLGKNDEQDIIREELAAAGIDESGKQGQNALRTESAHTSHRLITRYSPVLNKPYPIKDSSNPAEAQSEWGAINGYGGSISQHPGVINSFMNNPEAMAKTAKELGISVDDLKKEIDSMRENFVADNKTHATIIKNIAEEDKITESYITKINKKVLASRLNSGYYDSAIPISTANPETAKKQHEIGAKRYGYALDMNAILNNPELQTAENIAALKNTASASGMKITPGSRLDELVKSGAAAGKAVDTGARSKSGVDANSPSKKGVKTGEDYVAGLKEGVTVAAPSLLTEGKQVASTMHDGVDEGLNGSAGTSRIQGIFNKAFGANSKVGGMMSRFSSMGMMGKMGIGMGLSAVTQMASPLINKLPGGNLITDALSGASMGAGFGPWGMAAGAALTLVGGGIKSLMAAEKQHAAESKADFTSSASAVQFMGGTVANTTTALKIFDSTMTDSTNPALDNSINKQTQLAKGILYTKIQLDSFNESLKSLPKDDPLSLIVKQITGADPAKASKLVNDFVNMQMAVNGISVSQAQQLQQLILSSGNQNPNSGLGVMPTQISAIKASLAAALPDAKQFSQVLGQLVMGAANSSNLQQYETYIKGIGTTAATSAQQLSALYSFFSNNPQIQQLIKDMQTSNKGFTAQDVGAAVTALNSGHDITFDKLMPGKVSSMFADPTKNVNPKYASLLKQQADLQKQIADATSGANVAIAGQTTAVANNVSGLTKQQKLLDAQLKSLQDLQKQQSQKTSYNTTKEDLKNQIIMAQATGDNLKAQLLQQQLLGTTSDYNLQNKVDSAQQAADANRLKLDNANNAVAAAQTVATKDNTATLATLNQKLTAVTTALSSLPGGAINYSSSAGSAPQSTYKKNQASPQTAGQTLGYDKKTGQPIIAGSPNGPAVYNPSLPYTIPSGMKVVYNPHWFNKHQVEVTGPDAVDQWTDSKSGHTFWPNGRVTDNKNKLIGMWANANGLGGISTFAKGGVARTNSSITYHKQHMNRQARHFDTGGHITGPGSATSDSIPAMLSNGEYVIKASAVAHYGKGTFDALNAVRLAKGGVARTNSSITFHKQHMNRQARHFAVGGYVPSAVSGLMSLSHPSFASGGFVNAPVSANNGNIVYNINVTAPGSNANEIAKVVMDTLKQAEQRMAMSGRKTRVGQ